MLNHNLNKADIMGSFAYIPDEYTQGMHTDYVAEVGEPHEEHHYAGSHMSACTVRWDVLDALVEAREYLRVLVSESTRTITQAYPPIDLYVVQPEVDALQDYPHAVEAYSLVEDVYSYTTEVHDNAVEAYHGEDLPYPATTVQRYGQALQGVAHVAHCCIQIEEDVCDSSAQNRLDGTEVCHETFGQSDISVNMEACAMPTQNSMASGILADEPPLWDTRTITTRKPRRVRSHSWSGLSGEIEVDSRPSVVNSETQTDGVCPNTSVSADSGFCDLECSFDSADLPVSPKESRTVLHRTYADVVKGLSDSQTPLFSKTRKP